ncbi:hypothetical protein ACFL1H_00895 [Nanoarchaeota archaeon]
MSILDDIWTNGHIGKKILVIALAIALLFGILGAAKVNLGDFGAVLIWLLFAAGLVAGYFYHTNNPDGLLIGAGFYSLIMLILVVMFTVGGALAGASFEILFVQAFGMFSVAFTAAAVVSTSLLKLILKNE